MSKDEITSFKDADDELFRDAIQGLLRGDFSRLEPLFTNNSSPVGKSCHIIEWYEKGYFEKEPEALQEAFTCACFLGQTAIADFLLKQGVDPSAGASTGLNGFHWAANRGQLDMVKLLIERQLPLEIKNLYGGTVLGGTVWAAVHESKAAHLAIIEALLEAGANVDAASYPSGDERVDEVLRRYGAKLS
jgi:hypothetical protein